MLLISYLYRAASVVVICSLLVISPRVIALGVSPKEADQLYKSVLMDKESSLKDAKALYLQAKKDKNRSDELGYLYLYTLSDSYAGTGKKLLVRVKKGIKLAESLNAYTYLADFYALRSKILFEKKDDNKARASIQKAISLALSNQNAQQEFIFKLHLADILLSQYNASKALLLVSEAYNYFERESHGYEMALALKAFASIYQANQQWEKAIEYYLKALKLNSLDKQGPTVSVIYMSIAKAYQQTHKFKQSEKYLTKALKIFEQLAFSSGIGEIYFYRAKNQLGLLAFEQSIEQYNNAINYFDKTDKYEKTFYSHLGLVQAYEELNDVSLAQVHLKRAKGLYKKHQSDSLAIALLETEKKYYEKREKYKKAYQLYQQLETLKSEYKTRKNRDVLHKLQENFDGEIKEKENELLTKENKLQKAIITEQKLSIYLQVTLLIFFCVVISFMFYIQVKTKKNNKELMKLALTDNLTGVANRRSIMLKAAEEFDRAKRYKQNLTLGVVDLDFFKRINDLYGHSEGDEVLKAFCSVTESNIRLQDKLGRYGGEEFIVIFPHTDICEIQALITRISMQLREYSLPDPDHKVTFSIGVTKLLPSDDSVDDMVKRADEALYMAKEQGRDRLIEL